MVILVSLVVPLRLSTLTRRRLPRSSRQLTESRNGSWTGFVVPDLFGISRSLSWVAGTAKGSMPDLRNACSTLHESSRGTSKNG